MVVVVEAVIRVYIDADTLTEIRDGSDIRDHIKDSVRRTGDKHPEDPLFQAIEQVKLSKVRFYKA